MNIRKLIGLGLLAAFAFCQQGSRQYVPTLPTLPTNANINACTEISRHSWIDEHGLANEAVEIRDEADQVHQIHTWTNLQG